MSHSDVEPHNQSPRPGAIRLVTTPAVDSQAMAQSRWLDVALLVLCSLPALAIAGPVAVLNWICFGDWRQVFYAQERVGLNGKTFVLWKFRTLGDECDEHGDKRSDQERATAFGRLLRNTHLDELPQIFNVLRGDMSFIGPRPEMVPLHEWACERIPGFAERLILRPGITGLAQVTQGYASQGVGAYAKKLSIDCEYISQRSLLFDLRILAMTGVWMLRGKGWQWQQQGETSKETSNGTSVEADGGGRLSDFQPPCAREDDSRKAA